MSYTLESLEEACTRSLGRRFEVHRDGHDVMWPAALQMTAIAMFIASDTGEDVDLVRRALKDMQRGRFAPEEWTASSSPAP